MIEDNLIIDTNKKEISINTNEKMKKYTVKQLYSYLMDVFDEPEYMRYELPIEASDNNTYTLLNGWVIEQKLAKILIGNLFDESGKKVV